MNDLAGQSSLSEIIDVKKVFFRFFIWVTLFTFLTFFYFPDVFLFLKNVGKV